MVGVAFNLQVGVEYVDIPTLSPTRAFVEPTGHATTHCRGMGVKKSIASQPPVSHQAAAQLPGALEPIPPHRGHRAGKLRSFL